MAESKRGWVWDNSRMHWYSSDGHVVAARRFGASTPKFELDRYVDRFNEGIQPFTFGGEATMPNPHFTKKHYEQLAIVLKNSMANLTNAEDKLDMYIGASMVVTALMNHFEKDNPRFDRHAFLKAIKES